MRPDLAAALRLMSALPVRTHERRAVVYSGNSEARTYLKRIGPQRTRGGISRPVRVGRRTFPSITQAKTALRISPVTLYEMLDDGRAQYV